MTKTHFEEAQEIVKRVLSNISRLEEVGQCVKKGTSSKQEVQILRNERRYYAQTLQHLLSPLRILANEVETMEKMGRFTSKGLEVGDLVERKNKAYGDSFAKSGQIIKILYPNGVKVEQYDDMLAIVRILDKLFRIATDRDALGETPWNDVTGYGILGAVRVEKEKASENSPKRDITKQG